MSVFGRYADCYDLLYKDKDYAGETRFVDSMIRGSVPAAANLLEVGCGTGRYAECFAPLGYRVVGMDRSARMIARARMRNPALRFFQGDLADFAIDEKFDAVVALFHVISYLTTEEQLRLAFANMAQCMRPGGVLVFDCWHGPAVLHLRPDIRVRRVSEGDTRIVRIAEPEMVEDDHRVDVNFQVFFRDSEGWDEIRETHAMRYLFESEVEAYLSAAGLRLLHVQEWLTGKKPDRDSWNVVYSATLR